MNTEAAKSPFQIRDWRIVRFNYANGIFSPDSDAHVEWKLTFHRTNQYDIENQVYVGTLCIEFEACLEQEQRKMELSGAAYSMFTFEAEQSEDHEKQMESLLKFNGLSFSIGMLRNYIAMQSDLLKTRVHMIVPNINLKNVEYDQEITL